MLHLVQGFLEVDDGGKSAMRPLERKSRTVFEAQEERGCVDEVGGVNCLSST